MPKGGQLTVETDLLEITDAFIALMDSALRGLTR